MNVLTDCQLIWLNDIDIDDTSLALNLQDQVTHSFHPFKNLSDCSRFIERIALKHDLQQYLEDRWSSGICLFTESTTQTVLDKLDANNAKFMWFQLLLKVLLRMPYNDRSKHDLVEQLFLKYQSADAISWYAKANFIVYRLFNQACRTDNIELLFSYRFYLRDLYDGLMELSKKQNDDNSRRKLTSVFRGTRISAEELGLLQTSSDERKIIWFNSFISTSKKEDVAAAFIAGAVSTSEHVYAMLEIHLINDGLTSASVPFANIQEVGGIPDEEEVLIGMGAVFQLISIDKKDDGNYKITLELINYEDDIRNALKIYLEKEIEEETSLVTLSKFLIWMGDYEKSEKYCKILLKELPDEHPDRAEIYNSLGYTYQKQNRFKDARECLITSLEIDNMPDFIPDNNNKRKERQAAAYNNLGLVQAQLGSLSDAIESINRSLDLRQDEPNQCEEQRKKLAVERSYCHENFCIVYRNMSDYFSALKHCEMALNIRKDCLPYNHYLIAQSYNNLAMIYNQLGRNKEGRECTIKALKLQIESLPDNHPNLGAMYNTLGQTYYALGDLSITLETLQRALDTVRKARTVNRMLELYTLSNLGTVYKAQGDFDGALRHFLPVLTLIEELKPNHPDIVLAMNNIGFAYRDKGETATALIYFQNAMNFCEQHLPENTEPRAITYFSLGTLLDDNEWEKAMNLFDRTVSIYNNLGMPHHQNVAGVYRYKGLRYRQKFNHQLALASYEEALYHCRAGGLPSQHSLWVSIYKNSAEELILLNDFEHALEQLEKAFDYGTEQIRERCQIRNSIDRCQEQLLLIDVNEVIKFIIDQIVLITRE